MSEQSIFELIKEVFADVINKRKQKTAVKRFKEYVDRNGWPISVSKDDMLKMLNTAINEELPDRGMGDMIDIMAGVQRVAIQLTSYQQARLRELADIVRNAEITKCDHINFGISVFIHGGGFSPTFNLPELICLDCGLNVTFTNKKPEFYKESVGIVVSWDFLNDIFEWAKDCKRVRSSDNIPQDPIGEYNKSESFNKWVGAIPIDIIDRALFESCSGK